MLNNVYLWLIIRHLHKYIDGCKWIHLNTSQFSIDQLYAYKTILRAKISICINSHLLYILYKNKECSQFLILHAIT